MEQSFIAFLEDSIQKNWDLDALTDYKGATLQYKDVARKIAKFHIVCRYTFCDGSRCRARLEKIASDFLPRANLRESAVFLRIKVDG